MTKKFKRAALFDLDGVIVDSEGIYTEFWADIEREYPTGVDDFAHVIKGNTLARILNTYFAPEVHAPILERLRQQEDEMQYRLFDGIIDLMQRMHDKGWGIAIVTSSNDVKMKHLFEQLPRLRPYVDTLVTDGDVTNSKPDPEGYLLAAKRLGCNPVDCVVFEDSIAGIEAGRRAGATVVAIATTNPREVLEPLTPYVLAQASEFQL